MKNNNAGTYHQSYVIIYTHVAVFLSFFSQFGILPGKWFHQNHFLEILFGHADAASIVTYDARRRYTISRTNHWCGNKDILQGYILTVLETTIHEQHSLLFTATTFEGCQLSFCVVERKWINYFKSIIIYFSGVVIYLSIARRWFGNKKDQHCKNNIVRRLNVET